MTDLLQRTGSNLLRMHRKFLCALEAEAMPVAYSDLLADPGLRMDVAFATLLPAMSFEGPMYAGTEVSPGEEAQFGRSAHNIDPNTGSFRHRAEALTFQRATSTNLAATLSTRQPNLDVQSAKPAQRFLQPDSLPEETGNTRLPLSGAPAEEQPEVPSEPADRVRRLPQPGSLPEAAGSAKLQGAAAASLPSPELLPFPRTGSAPQSAAASFVQGPTASAPARPPHTQEIPASYAPSMPKPSQMRTRTISSANMPTSAPGEASIPLVERSLTRMALGAPAVGALLQANLVTPQCASLAAQEVDLHPNTAVTQTANSAPKLVPFYTILSPPAILVAPDVEALLEELEKRLRLELLRAYGTSGA